MFGSHLSIAGGLENALLKAHQLDMDCVQVFTKNQRQWNVPPLTDDQVDRWEKARIDTGLVDIVSHDSYLINLASPKPEVCRKSIALYREELIRCDRLNIPYLVMHPGAHLKTGEDVGLAAVADALNNLHAELPDLQVITCLEITAGQGTTLGYRFEHLARIIDMIDQPARVGVCLDTAHLLGAGYDLTSAAGARRVIRECDDILSLDRVHVLHLNDSKVERGSRKDRHEHIGQGYVALDAFKTIVNHPHFKSIPKILETPKDNAPDGRPWDVVNLETLRSFVTQKRRSTHHSATKPNR